MMSSLLFLKDRLSVCECGYVLQELKTEKVPKYHSKSVRLPWAKASTANYFLLKLLKDQSELALCDAGWIAE